MKVPCLGINKDVSNDTLVAIPDVVNSILGLPSIVGVEVVSNLLFPQAVHGVHASNLGFHKVADDALIVVPTVRSLLAVCRVEMVAVCRLEQAMQRLGVNQDVPNDALVAIPDACGSIRSLLVVRGVEMVGGVLFPQAMEWLGVGQRFVQDSLHFGRLRGIPLASWRLHGLANRSEGRGATKF